jgi:predicted CxxxxCH...CXXCH cytochrome family protein
MRRSTSASTWSTPLVVALALLAGCDLGSHPVIDGGASENGPSTGCSGTCHGQGESIAPPRDTTGRTDLDSIGVGAHQAHLAGSDWHKRYTCDTCHTVPSEVGEVGHILVAGASGMVRDELPAELTPGGMGTGMTWDHATATCTGSYCHGDTLNQVDPTNNMVVMGAGGTITQPVWTVLDGSQKECGACHGNPPPAPHPAQDDCGLCHQSMNPGDFALGKISYPELHINGVVEVSSTQPCDACHGGGGQSAPPRDVAGNTLPTSPGVGAHAQHMIAASPWHAPIACNECHQVPGSTADQTHLNQQNEVYLDPTELVPGSPTGTGTGGVLQIAGARYDAAAHTCSSTYCHGGGGSPLRGGNAITPQWTRVDGTQTRCGSCHGAPPPSPHPQNGNCGTCHPTMTAGNNTTITYPARHIDGNVDVINDQACDTCHGSGGESAPPRDTTGGTATNLRTVGAHRNHLGASGWRALIECSACHRVPTSTTSIGHTDSALPAELTFGPAAGAGATWNGTTCSNTYCHGATLGAGGLATRPVWTNVDGSQSQCTSCHGAPPPAPHPADPDCGTCHDTMTAGGGLVITDPSRHIDGNLDVDGDQACNSCHGSTGSDAPPEDTQANTATNTRGVGAHQSHLNPAPLYFRAIACGDCHQVPGTVSSLGHVDTPLPAELRFSARAGTSPAWNGATCANVYCHGSTLTSGTGGAGGTATTPIWSRVDGTQAQCTSCHGFPPPAPHPQNSDCGDCHNTVQAGSNMTFVNAAAHIDGNLDVDTNQACNSCHGGTNNAPPSDTSGGTTTTLRGVGAHQAHVLASSPWHAPTNCGQCHQVPGTVNSVGHLDTALPAELRFTGIAAGSTWNGSNCSTYCHGSTLAAGGTATNPQWTRVDGSQSDCGACHGVPPPPPHPTGTACESCHPNAGPGQTITDPSTHIDGTVQVTAGATHPAGYGTRIMHGYDVDRSGVGSCATAGCHGTTLTGGTSGGPSCATVTGCHSNIGSGFTWQTQCTFCHGNAAMPAGNGAPPQGTLGATAATDRSVGAHQVHLGATAMHGAWDCNMCHTKPTGALTPGHLDGTGNVVQAEVRYSTLNPTATYNTTNATCGSMYCHGNGRTSAGTAVWTSTTDLTCTSCHPTTALTSGEHKKHIRDENMDCVECHQTVVNAAMGIIAPALHVNGTKEVKMPNGTYNPANKACSGLGNGCHGTETW